jgi:hypothetical protein
MVVVVFLCATGGLSLRTSMPIWAKGHWGKLSTVLTTMVIMNLKIVVGLIG